MEVLPVGSLNFEWRDQRQPAPKPIYSIDLEYGLSA